ncbi:hypothetical protein AYI70_g3822 [Smittium culicis]|uniref:Uncharacterized protein n=1 Tax=Smittium culicis TaxID=133412 RepID=A0A1R1Y251_9FUNG|nr:hypothetical protein AYI70_g3822 [Smittium culicis]
MHRGVMRDITLSNGFSLDKGSIISFDGFSYSNFCQNDYEHGGVFDPERHVLKKKNLSDINHLPPIWGIPTGETDMSCG